MDLRLTWTYCDETGDYVVPNVLSPRDLVSRPDNIDETVLHTQYAYLFCLWVQVGLGKVMVTVGKVKGGMFYSRVGKE